VPRHSPGFVARLSLSWLSLLIIFASVLPACGSGPSADERRRAVAAFETVQRVLQHPRCQNCHIPEDTPLQYDDGQPHVQAVVRGPEGKGAPGLPCTTCHGSTNPPASYGANAPPGAPNWQLPPPEQKMVFKGLSPSELCRALVDKSRNGGKNLTALVEHISHDRLVLWGWTPGTGRTPVPIPHQAFVAQFKQWAAAAAPCPDT